MNYLIDKYLKYLLDNCQDSFIETLSYVFTIRKYSRFKFTYYNDFVQRIKKRNWDKGQYELYRNGLKLNPPVGDFRIRRLYIKNFRKFGTHDDCGYMFGATTKTHQDKDVCASVFLVGKNGSGKTSLFSALEYVFNLPEFSSMKLRGLDDTEKFLPYGDKAMKDVEVTAVFNTLKDDKLNEKDAGGECCHDFKSVSHNSWLDMSPLFCSEKDLYELYRCHDLKDVFLNSLGYGEIRDMIKELKEYIQSSSSSQQNLWEYQSLHTTYNMEILRTDIMRLGDRYNKYKEIIAQIGKFVSDMENIKSDLSKNTDDFMESRIYKIQAMKKFLVIYDSLPRIKELAYFQSIQPTIENYRNIAGLYPNEALSAFEIENRTMDFNLLVNEILSYLAKLRAPFNQANINNDSSLHEVVLYTFENIHKESGVEKEFRRYKKNVASNYPQDGEQGIDVLRKIVDILERQFKKDCSDFVDNCRTFVLPVLKSFTALDQSNRNEESLEIMSLGDKIVAEICNEPIIGEKKTSPQYFYNSFRYKLFCVSIKISLAFMMMKIHRFNAPIVIDDVFTASDFDNTVNIDIFYSHLVSAFHKTTGMEPSQLQLILFTHDEVVLNGFRAAYQSELLKSCPYIAGRLLDASLLDEESDRRGDYYILYDSFSS